MYVRISDAVVRSVRAACIDRFEPADKCTYVWRRIACVRNMLNSARVSLGFVRFLGNVRGTAGHLTQQRAERYRFLTSAIMAQIAATRTLFEK